MRLRGTNQEFGRPYNRRIVLETIRLKGPISRAAIAREVHLSTQTVSTIIRELEGAGFLHAAREKPTRRGQPATMLEINGDGAFAIGLQLTTSELRGGVINLAGDILAMSGRALRSLEPETVFQIMSDLVTDLSRARPGGRILGIGLAMPGPFGVEPMSFVGSTTIEGWQGIPIAERIRAHTGFPAFIDIDASAAALGERRYGAGKQIKDFYYLYFGMGLGGGYLHEGDVLHGAFGNAGEIGHLPLDPTGETCPCGNRGCLERYLSLDALCRRLATAGLPTDTDSLTKLVSERHPLVESWITEVVPLLRRALVIVENLFDPAAVVVGGLLPELLIDRLLAAVQPLLPSVGQREGRVEPRIVRSQIGPDVALLGAAVLAISGMLSPRFGLMFADGDLSRGRPDPIMARAARFGAGLAAE